MTSSLSRPLDPEATNPVKPRRKRGKLIATVLAVIAVAAAVWVWQRQTRRKPVPVSQEVVAAIPTIEQGKVVMPEAAELVRKYQGRVQQQDGTKLWLFIDIRSAEVRDGRISFKYFMNSPTQSVTGDGEVDPDGRIRFSGFRGRVVRKKDALELQSIGIEGPPYWRLVGRNEDAR